MSKTFSTSLLGLYFVKRDADGSGHTKEQEEEVDVVRKELEAVAIKEEEEDAEGVQEQKGDAALGVELVVAGKIDPVAVETRDVSKANETLKEMKDGDLLGLVALTHD